MNNRDEKEYLAYWLIFPDGKMYIGISGGSETKRWDNGNGYIHQKELYAAIQAVGWENVTHQVLGVGMSKKEIECLERYLIKKYDTTNPEKGYNKATGGFINSGYTHSAEARAKMSKSATGKKISNATKSKISESLLFVPKTEEHKHNIQLHHARSVPVKCVESGVSYISMSVAAEMTGANRKCIANVLSGKQQTAGGLHWVKSDPLPEGLLVWGED